MSDIPQTESLRELLNSPGFQMLSEQDQSRIAVLFAMEDLETARVVAGNNVAGNLTNVASVNTMGNINGNQTMAPNNHGVSAPVAPSLRAQDFVTAVVTSPNFLKLSKDQQDRLISCGIALQLQDIAPAAPRLLANGQLSPHPLLHPNSPVDNTASGFATGNTAIGKGETATSHGATALSNTPTATTAPSAHNNTMNNPDKPSNQDSPVDKAPSGSFVSPEVWKALHPSLRAKYLRGAFILETATRKEEAIRAMAKRKMESNLGIAKDAIESMHGVAQDRTFRNV
ncbi:expressed unknown protein [Seminavis robusta]|uniref:Uncharacterized protein n=1 Tax=Seminavis robusta TaxID=568900 RepID=A0A9N8E903_9STRA|nr:expressed unknown protein [Seminavis robusta]|eukprot:Sro817_g206870.1 n/a (285) ;mRNA; r:37131-37985